MKLRLKTHLILAYLLIVVTLSDLIELWTIEQLDDMVLSDAFKYDVPARTPVVLGLYEKTCKTRLYRDHRYRFTDRGFPNSMHVLFATFDRETARTEPWYTWEPEIMDVFVRYNISTEGQGLDDWCPIVLYQPANWSEPIQYYDPSNEESFNDWVWRMISIQVTFNNNELDYPVSLSIRYKDENVGDITDEAVLAVIESGQSQTLTLHAGDTIVVQNSKGEILNRHIIDTIIKTIDITKTEDVNIINDEKWDKTQSKAHRLRVQRDWSTRRRYLNNIRSPPLMPSFTEHGFKHTKVPDEVCNYVKTFYQSAKEKKRVEGFPKDGTQINTREIPTYMMHIPGDKKRWISDQIKPLLEEWSGTQLRYSTMYGLREYVTGAVLKGHVDRIETHIISAIIHVTHSPQDVLWPVEVVSWDGKRYYINDTDCDMVFYESSKLIHGRPSTYQGDSWINAFLHFRPMQWNGYTFTAKNRIVTPQGERDLVDFVYG